MITATPEMRTVTEENPLKTLLEETGIGRSEFGRLVGTHHTTISNKATGKTALTAREIVLYKLLTKLHREGQDVREILKNLA